MRGADRALHVCFVNPAVTSHLVGVIAGCNVSHIPSSTTTAGCRSAVSVDRQGVRDHESHRGL